ncbi:YcxB family protein [Spirosoma sp. BT702]|uniref:YcxB family protein n=1 Tax=Spirosoma profusum TaxID=2771354 RepID=A0A926Y3J8_9BACT|nr:YcxB family protein [Spirosoma profusum]MBD2704177.1 YcxB family protein [Spirosoma profusum]
MFQTTFKLSQQELYKGLIAINRSLFITKLTKGIGILVTLISLSILFSNLYAGHYSIFTGGFSLLIGVYLIFGTELIVWRQSKKLVENNAQITETTTYTFDQTNYQLEGESFSTRLDYAKLHEVRETKEFILFRVSQGLAHVVPRRALSIEQLAGLKGILAAIPGLKLEFR